MSPETITAYEVGFKTAQDIFHFDIADFYYDNGDLHVATSLRSPQCGAVPPPPAPDTCNQFLNVYLNAPKAEAYGIDAQLTATPMENLSLRAGAAWLKATYKKFPNAVGTASVARRTSISTISLRTGPATRWRELRNFPETSASIIISR